MTKVFHVSKNGLDTNEGTESNPLLTINTASKKAYPGDKIIVHEGTYREWVNPVRGGLSSKRRITYEAAEGEQIIIKGSERIKDWELVEEDIWKVTIQNEFFNGENPYKKTVNGDWLEYKPDVRHLGDVYLNGMSFYETETYEELLNVEMRDEILDHWTNEVLPIKNTEQTKYAWYCEVDESSTVIYAKFNDYNPNNELVEINVRQSSFYPKETGINYITVRGFEMAHGATPWTPPTADQPGLVGTNWSKGWIIEDNVIHDAKTSGISIGKEKSTGHNFRTERKDKPGYIYQQESVFAAKKKGWSKETIGSHIIRNNTIYDCGQNAIVGHLGCIFSEITNNHIYNIGIKREFYGHEIAGIKLHAAIDVLIQDNYIHDTSLGLWLDWEAQGSRVSKNIFNNNSRDFFIEVTHGPHIVDHNIFGSKYSVDNHAQGTAYVNNLFGGKMEVKKILDRSTPYHVPHSTDILGSIVVYGGDERFYQNIFVGSQSEEVVGTSMYNDSTSSLEEYIETVDSLGVGDHNMFNQVEQPVYVSNNAYFDGAEVHVKEDTELDKPEFESNFSISEEKDGVYLNLKLPDDFEDLTVEYHSTTSLPRVRIVDAEFEDTDGSELVLDTDYFGEEKGTKNTIGPMNILKSGSNKIKVFSLDK